MLKNKTNITKENVAYITKLRLKSVAVLLYRVFVFCLGIFFVLVGMSNLDVPHPDFVQVIIFCILGLVFIIFSTYGISFLYRIKNRKISYVEVLREYKINSSCFVVSMINNNLKATNEFLYTNFDLAIKKGNYYYIR